MIIGNHIVARVGEKQAKEKVEVKIEMERWLETSADCYWQPVGCLDKSTVIHVASSEARCGRKQ